MIKVGTVVMVFVVALIGVFTDGPFYNTVLLQIFIVLYGIFFTINDKKNSKNT